MWARSARSRLRFGALAPTTRPRWRGSCTTLTTNPTTRSPRARSPPPPPASRSPPGRSSACSPARGRTGSPSFASGPRSGPRRSTPTWRSSTSSRRCVARVLAAPCSRRRWRPRSPPGPPTSTSAPARPTQKRGASTRAPASPTTKVARTARGCSITSATSERRQTLGSMAPVRRWATAIVAMAAAAAVVPRRASGAALVPLAPPSAWESTPIHATAPPGAPRLFVVERGGGVRIFENGALLPTPFLTVPNVDTGGERGLLSLAFSPDYASSGLLYVFTVAKAPGKSGAGPGDVQAIEYRRSPADPDLADSAYERLVLEIPHSADNHNGRQNAFRPPALLHT